MNLRGSLDERNAEAVMRLLTSLARQLEMYITVGNTQWESRTAYGWPDPPTKEGNCMLWPVVKALLGHTTLPTSDYLGMACQR